MAAASAKEGPILYLPRDVARILKCSEWWVKEQARRRRIPFCWIGGGYRFTPDHLAEIIRVFERKTTGGEVISVEEHRTRRRRPTQPPTDDAAPLVARIPRRARKAQDTEQPDAA